MYFVLLSLEINHYQVFKNNVFLYFANYCIWICICVYM